jgi:hypothetical protein
VCEDFSKNTSLEQQLLVHSQTLLFLSSSFRAAGSLSYSASLSILLHPSGDLQLSNVLLCHARQHIGQLHSPALLAMLKSVLLCVLLCYFKIAQQNLRAAAIDSSS